jgi:hypothetical protein
MFHKVITAPASKAELDKVAKIYEILGMPGAVGSTDCTHIPLGKCPVSWKNQCTGKEGFPTLSYSMTCDHTRRIMACSGGFPGSYNDKTIARYDSFISDISQNALFKDFTYTLQTKSGAVQKKGSRLFSSNSELTLLQGAYLICDGGYHRWEHLICGMKQTSSNDSRLWSIQV